MQDIHPHSAHKATSANPQGVLDRIARNQTFVLNITAAWCPDCMQQAQFFDEFVGQMQAKGIDVLEFVAQQERKKFISESHEAVARQFGEPRFPRTALVLNGEIADGDNIEIMTRGGLVALAAKFIEKVSS